MQLSVKKERMRRLESENQKLTTMQEAQPTACSSRTREMHTGEVSSAKRNIEPTATSVSYIADERDVQPVVPS